MKRQLRISIGLLLLLLISLMAACSSNEPGDPSIEGLIADDGSTPYVIIRSDTQTETTPYAISLKKELEQRTGATLQLSTDYVAREGSAAADQFKENPCEILVGKTTRELSKTLELELSRGLDWGIVREGTKIAIYGTDCLEEAIQYFLDSYVKDGNIYIEDGERYLRMGDYELDSLTINGRDIGEFTIQYDADVSYYHVIANKLAAELYEMTGRELTVEPLKNTSEPTIYLGVVGSTGKNKSACYMRDESLYAVGGSQSNPYDGYSLLMHYIKDNATDKKLDIPADIKLTLDGREGDVVGSAEEPNLWIHRLDNGIMLREAEFDSGKGGDPITIMQISDMHFNYCNEQDIAEADPVLMSTLENRKWLANGSSVPNAERCLEYAADADQIIVTGDTLDYLSHGCIELMKKVLWDKYPDAIATIGNHEPVRSMQGKLPESTPLEERYAMLEEAWEPYHDIYYYSKVLGDKAMVIQLDNSQNKYWDVQVEQLRSDIEIARENGYVVLIFQHVSLCSNNPAEANFYPLRINDGSGVPYNFHTGGLGANASGATKEVYELIVNNADVVRGVFCGHEHCDFYSEIIAKTSTGEDAIIPQYILTASAYDQGHVLKITVK